MVVFGVVEGVVAFGVPVEGVVVDRAGVDGVVTDGAVVEGAVVDGVDLTRELRAVWTGSRRPTGMVASVLAAAV